ncbi:substrate-binding domain-containing protein, partial [Robbsia andropogonis]|uniref:substrate-binding domain-containing protein n=1 Tax=Robbsia andropogonis TaxID=28092 RepID=UPI00209F5BAD
RLLHERGCRRLAAVMGPRETLSHGSRAAGFADDAARLGDAAEVLHGGYDYQWGWEAGGRLLARADRPDGLFCGNDLIAIGIVDRWTKEG